MNGQNSESKKKAKKTTTNKQKLPENEKKKFL